MATGEVGIIYLIHFDEPYKQAKHYLGWTTDLDSRMSTHRKGHGSCLLAAVKKAGIAWELVRTWEGNRDFERHLKNKKNAPRMCPVCEARRKEALKNAKARVSDKKRLPERAGGTGSLRSRGDRSRGSVPAGG